MKKYLKHCLVLICLLFGLSIFASPILAEDYKTKAMEGLGESAGRGYGTIPYSGENDTPSVIIGQIIGIGLSFIGVIFFILLLYGGFTWMMARGNEQEVEKALGMLQAAVFGLVVVMMAYALTAFLSGAFTSSS